MSDSQISVNPTPKDALLQLSARSGLPLKDLVVLAPGNDPFNSGSSSQVTKAQWAAGLFRRFCGTGTHLRRLHYILVSQEKLILKPDGDPYRNTDKDWHYLQVAAAHARYQGLINPLDLVDNRNDDPHLFAADPVDPPEPHWAVDDFYGFTLPSMSFNEFTDFDLPGINTYGYNYSPGEQPYYLELWIEKTTMNDVLLPLCRRYNVNFVTSSGFQSITNAVMCLSRVPQAATMKRPVRVFYISDYDPAGYHMPVAVSRQFEFWADQLGTATDLKLTPLALTKEQVKAYQLPRVPVKNEDLRKDGWEAIHGEGAVELDALEALHPGALAEIVEDQFLEYRDVDLHLRLTEAGEEAQAEADSEWESFLGSTESQAAAIEKQAEGIVEEFMPKFHELKAEFDERMKGVQGLANELEAEVHRAIENAEHMDLELPERPVPLIEQPDESGWLFDATRSYFEQLRYYQNYKQGEDNGS